MEIIEDDDHRREGLKRAQECARQGDARGMIEYLHASGYLTGMKRRLGRNWQRLPPADLDDCIAEVVAETYERVAAGKRVSQLGGYLATAAHHRAQERWGRVKDHDSELDAVAQPQSEDGDRRQIREQREDDLRREAIRLARELLPVIGTGQLRDVMDLLIDAVEAGEPELPADSVGEILGITAAAARALMSRGLSRLRDAAAKRGITMEGVLETPPVHAELDAQDDSHD